MSMPYLLTTPAARQLARSVYASSALDDRRLARAHGLSYHTARLTLRALVDAGAITMRRPVNGTRSISVVADAPVWDELLGGQR